MGNSGPNKEAYCGDTNLLGCIQVCDQANNFENDSSDKPVVVEGGDDNYQWLVNEPKTSTHSVIENAFRVTPDLSDEYSAMVKDEPTEKVLGVGLDFETDCMFVRIGKRNEKKVETKVDMLSFVSSVFDPMGLVSAYILKGRIFFQQTNELKLEWKDKIPDEIKIPFDKWKESIIHLRKIKIPRWTSMLGYEDSEVELISFSDASSTAYGCVFYTRRVLKGGGNGKALVRFLLAKSHVVPLSMLKNPIKNQEAHQNSIPRLELVAAKLSAIWRDTIVRESRETFAKIWHFTDSITVLRWIEDFDRRFKTFENFRVKQIRNLTKISEWRFISTELNPADVLSKGVNGDDTQRINFYLSGPSFLELPEEQWPPRLPESQQKKEKPEQTGVPAIAIGAFTIEKPIENEDNETDLYPEFSLLPIQLVAIGSTTEDPEIEIETIDETPWPLKLAAKKRSWKGKVRAISIIALAIRKLRERVNERKNNPNNAEPKLESVPTENEEKRKYILLERQDYEKAEYLLISAVQSVHFSAEIVTLIKNGVTTPNSIKELSARPSRLRNLAPFVDDNNILRAGGRLRKATDLPYEQRHPAILPNQKDETIKCLIRSTHVDNMHCDRRQTFYMLREKYFILGGKAAVNKVIDVCLTCQRQDKLPQIQRMGDLPTDRLKIIAPFETSGLDIFGPFPVRHGGRGTCKRWVLLITCFITRAICLLPVKDLTTTTIINALVKMSAQFPSLRKIYSDNGSNFRGTERTLREAIAQWDQNEVNEKLSHRTLQWCFGPARCGSAGGVWERLIGMCKGLIKKEVGSEILHIDTFESVLAGVMSIMNNRPLTEASTAIDDYNVLTPAHFLYPHKFTSSSLSILPPASEHANCLKDSWKKTQSMIDRYWVAWRQTYLETLRKRTKWHRSSDGPRIGQLVALVDTNTPRDLWKFGRVHEIISSDPHHVRRIRVRDSNGTIFDRHVQGIVQLELDES